MANNKYQEGGGVWFGDETMEGIMGKQFREFMAAWKSKMRKQAKKLKKRGLIKNVGKFLDTVTQIPVFSTIAEKIAQEKYKLDPTLDVEAGMYTGGLKKEAEEQLSDLKKRADVSLTESLTTAGLEWAGTRAGETFLDELFPSRIGSGKKIHRKIEGFKEKVKGGAEKFVNPSGVDPGSIQGWKDPLTGVQGTLKGYSNYADRTWMQGIKDNPWLLDEFSPEELSRYNKLKKGTPIADLMGGLLSAVDLPFKALKHVPFVSEIEKMTGRELMPGQTLFELLFGSSRQMPHTNIGTGTGSPVSGDTYGQGGQVPKYKSGGTISDYFSQQGKTLGGSNLESLSEQLNRK